VLLGFFHCIPRRSHDTRKWRERV